ncbi:MAG TPA: ATP-binding cassette domain-containing protein [Candidatus Sulfotelmatobacter sp.]|nr:ATP-binding cassette domain-containing protein [Candidatus Sulfotelmatobacter sp.]
MVSAPPLIGLDRVTVRLDGRPVLHEISWELRSGEQWAIVGGNGAGKSTLLAVIRGDRWPERDGGRRTYALAGAPQHVGTAARQIGAVSPEQQERYARLALEISGRELIASGLRDTTYVQGALADDEATAVDALIERFGLRALAAASIRTLSFGQLRMLLVARALVREPRVLVLDEFANGLDRRARHALLDFLDQVAERTQVIASAHRAEDLPAATTNYVRLAGGRIVESGGGRPPAHHRFAHAAPFAPATTPRPAAGVPGEPLVVIRNADVYREETLVLRAVDWSIARGEHTAVYGANGSGKSTFAELVAGTLPAAYGAEIERFGARGPFDVRELRRRIAHVSDALQIAYDANPTVERAIASGFTASIGTVESPSDEQRAAVAAIVHRLGLEPLCGQRFRTLSFGERRKVLLARGLVAGPELLILDEVWSGLDAPFRAALAPLLDELAARGTTLLAISHHVGDVPALVHRTFVVDDGQVREVPVSSP